MSVDTKSVEGRREVHYESYDQLLTDAERLAQGDPQMVGNWSLGQIYKHLGNSLEASIDGAPFTAPLFLRLMAKTFMKKKFLYGSVPPGFQIPENAQKRFQPADSTTVEEGLEILRHGIERVTNESKRADHPVFGKLSKDEWDNFSLRHAEMHMSFAVPSGE